MTDAKNLEGRERVIRTIVGGILIVVGFFLQGFWKPLALVAGLSLLFTAYIAYCP